MLNPELTQRVHFLYYRFKHILLYTIIGVFSIVCELIVRSVLIVVNIEDNIASYTSVSLSVAIAFILNVKFNFNIPNKKLRLALFYFVIISIFSFILQNILSDSFFHWGWSYEQSRLFISGLLFLFIYYLHRRFSFSERREVGVAVYANGIEDISKIKDKIDIFPDFIHVDIVDNTIKGVSNEVHAYRLEAINAHWRNSEIHTHIMSKKPSRWISDVAKYSDIVFIHDDIEEDILAVKSHIHSEGSEFGLALHAKNNYKNLENLLQKEKYVLVLSIEKAGHSGQEMMPRALGFIEKINNLPFRSQIKLCVDGGITSMNLNDFKSEQIVSGSHILNAQNPKLQIMKLQTKNEYSN